MKESSVRSVERAISILKSFTRDDSKLSLSDMAERSNLPITTTLRITHTMESLNLLQRNEDKTYSLGTQVYLLGSIAKANFRPQQIIYPYMRAIRDDTNEAVSLYGIEDEERVCFEHVESLLTMRCVMRVGDRAPLWAGAGGKVLLAFMGEDAVEREIEKAHSITSTTVYKPEELRKDLETIRERMFAVSWGEREEGIFSVAAPIFSMQGDILFSFSIAGPASRFTEEIGLALVPRIQKMCKEISLQMR
jgi:IclR family KDG regulon transcriptional repressor